MIGDALEDDLSSIIADAPNSVNKPFRSLPNPLTWIPGLQSMAYPQPSLTRFAEGSSPQNGP